MDLLEVAASTWQEKKWMLLSYQKKGQDKSNKSSIKARALVLAFVLGAFYLESRLGRFALSLNTSFT